MAKVIGADQNLIAALSHAVFAISIELGSGVGFWLVFGHGAPNRRRDETDRIASTALVPIDRGGAVDLQVIDDKPAEIIDRWLLEIMRPRLNSRVQSGIVWSTTSSGVPIAATARCRMPCLAGWRAGAKIGSGGLSGTWMPNLPRATPA